MRQTEYCNSKGDSGMLRRISNMMLVALALLSAQAFAASGNYVLEFGGARDTTELRLSIGKSQIIYSPRSLDQVVIGSPDVADIKLLSSRQVLILGKKPGHTNLVFRDKQRDLNAVIDVVVGYDLDGIKRKIYEVLPHERLIEIRGANDKVMLSGEVSSLASMDKAVAIASSYVPKKNVINMLQVGGGQQVMLKVKVSEMARSSLRELGVEFDATNTDAAGRTLQIVTGANLGFTSSSFLNATAVNSANDVADVITAKLHALEHNGLSKTLAEPNIVALSGQEASFLAGGEVPIPVTQTTTGAVPLITVDYKEFGVGLKFTPTVLSHDKINLKLNTEVSSLDKANGVTASGISIPAISTRRAGTTVEVGDGQSFAIAGLMQNDMTNAINQLPGLGDIPILGALFRSTSFQRNETELVVVVTPRLVKAVHGSKLRAPTDNFVPPNWFDQYLMGKMEVHKKYKQDNKKANESSEGSDTAPAGGEPAKKGVEGSFGHEL